MDKRGFVASGRCPVRRGRSQINLRVWYHHRLTLILLIYLISLQPSLCIKWLGLSNDRRQMGWNSTSDCSRSRSLGLVRSQRRLCHNHLDMMPSVVRASRDTVDMCQDLFSDRRWNCSTILRAPNFLPDLAGNSREQAFVQSLSTAVLVQAVSKACSAGLSSHCGCGPVPSEAAADHERSEQFQWGGCPDDLPYGLAFSRVFEQTKANANKRRKMSRRALVNKHNSDVGRQVMADSLSRHCKCHGVSGSCSMRTCFMSLPFDLRPVASQLRNRYSVAVHVDPRSGVRHRKSSRRAERTSRRRRGHRDRERSGAKTEGESGRRTEGLLSDAPAANSVDKFSALLTDKNVDEHDLVYRTISPDYCLPDTTLGSIGTRHRVCEKDSTDTDGCQSMCCGRGYTVETVVVKHHCDCKYYWCCYVKCKTCTKTVEISRCR